ncbi:CBS domain-containing protein [Methanothermobacter wolfeii]|jgi:predicted transcriptional regulator|uniref:CBS domain-containing protein n=1 Tax=Methanothermobacter wolfeii TaxID=145261 RepID=A0A9E7RSS7_METWO|nr:MULTISPECIES: CBS domain-containing protein [Methanothermobacter]MDI6702514.1 CBS domain-containing protein [Methanothermobacter wolfeii]MDI6841731.1 CBS domain-containing protein [Methanothermobacter wolfeii]NLM02479.1 CBS domain-containing protein [Methanothermobacter wolfeii]QHN06960.1 CBS domain-containing protein [Methanothermobacter sp. THM-1]UXH31548.1 CBS domain-containing protein [Methanothermobacter wolfeii]
MEMETKVTVHDAMTSNVITADPGISVAEAAAIMTERKVGSIIVKSNSEPEGLITESDIIRKVVSKDLRASEVKIGEVMSRNLISIEPERELSEAARLMAKNSIRRLPVVKDGALVGILTSSDVMIVAPELTDILVENARMEENRAQISEDGPSVPGVCEVCGNYEEYLEEYDGKYVCEECKEDLEGE